MNGLQLHYQQTRRAAHFGDRVPPPAGSTPAPAAQSFNPWLFVAVGVALIAAAKLKR